MGLRCAQAAPQNTARTCIAPRTLRTSRTAGASTPFLYLTPMRCPKQLRAGFERYRIQEARAARIVDPRGSGRQRRAPLCPGGGAEKVPGADATRGTLTRVGWRRAGTANATAFSGGMLWDFAEGTIAVKQSGDSCVSQPPSPFAPLCS